MLFLFYTNDPVPAMAPSPGPNPVAPYPVPRVCTPSSQSQTMAVDLQCIHGLDGCRASLQLYRRRQFLAVRTMEVTRLPKATTSAPSSSFHETPWNTGTHSQRHGPPRVILTRTDEKVWLLTGGFFADGMRNGLTFSPRSCMALVLTSPIGLSPACLWTSLDNSKWMACWTDRQVNGWPVGRTDR
jgi:hypothetical protein